MAVRVRRIGRLAAEEWLENTLAIAYSDAWPLVID
jgi:hypothetical protein